jgi:A/G-specific adenine glycosylase
MTSGPDANFPDPGSETVGRLHRRLLRWYARHGRSLPWRGRDDVYAVFISEFMLQQTQAARVSERLPAWLETFPDIQTLARAGKRSVLLAWSGMGYNRRALALYEAACIITTQFDGRIPDDPEVLQTLPGIGAYSAHAIACFAYRKRLPMVDVNIRRILSRLLYRQTDEAAMMPERLAWKAAAFVLPRRSYYNWNQALMDLGASICTARRPDCAHCPLGNDCLSSGRLQAVRQPHVPMVRETPRRIYRGKVVEMLRRSRGHTLPASEILHGMYGESERNAEHLRDVLKTLERDGLITLRPADEHASLERISVSLAE